MTPSIGEVISVSGTLVTLKIFESSNKDTLFYDGDKYKGVSLREYLTIRRGLLDIVCVVEGEYLDEKHVEQNAGVVNYLRRVEVKPIGFFKNDHFYEGIKYLPMIKDLAFLIPEHKVNKIFDRKFDSNFIIGRLLKEDLPVSIPWKDLFNTHIGIFGNTGSGKSNTLAKLFSLLFEHKKDQMKEKSSFILIDFNGEYTGNQFLTGEDKKIIDLTTKTQSETKFGIEDSEFWNSETLSILYQARPNTQKPFLERVINGRNRFKDEAESLINYTKYIFYAVFTSPSPKPECLQLLRTISDLVNNKDLFDKLKTIQWFNNTKFKGPGKNAVGKDIEYYEADGLIYDQFLRPFVEKIKFSLEPFQELFLRSLLQLTKELLHGYVQFDHIQPLIKRMESANFSLSKVLSIDKKNKFDDLLTIISLKKCNQDVKKVIPLLVAKNYYQLHKENLEKTSRKTIHLIIDEAHNILSEQSSRESESWKDYRLELFEEIIKEGRKFGVFLTLSSQRPADISPTIISQLHNFFIHRLVNERDLQLLDNTISTLDRVSKNLIPLLSKGACVVTGTTFTLPMVVQVDILSDEKQPDSSDVNLEDLWK